MGNRIQATVKANRVSSVLTVCRHGFHNDVMAYALQIDESTIHRIFVAQIVFVEAIFSCLNLKPDDDFYLAGYLRFWLKLDITSQTLQLPELNLSQCSTQRFFGKMVHISSVYQSANESSPPWLGCLQNIFLEFRNFYKPCSKKFGLYFWLSISVEQYEYSSRFDTVNYSNLATMILVH